MQSTDDHHALPLPGFLLRVYYVFPIVLYVPDAIFNFYVYSDGGGGSNGDLSSILFAILWGFLAAGLVGMAWLCSVLAPWHWTRGNRFQSIMCWLGVLIATAITTWNSLAYRSQRFSGFITDRWISDTFHLSFTGFSPTMVIVAVSPPFWGLFWAIVQPAIGKRSAAEAAEDHEAKLLRLKQEAEYKQQRAEANAQIRAAQLKGLAATVRSARAQIGGQEETTDTSLATVVEVPTGETAARKDQTLMRSLIGAPTKIAGENA